MKQHFTLITTALLVAAACNTEDYYRNANVPPELTASVDVDRIDTIKTSVVSNLRTYTMSVTATDENRNMNLLQVVAPTGSVKIDGVATDQQAIETTKERADFTRFIEFTPSYDGLHTITAKVTDDFNTSRSIEKRVYSFTNMPPKCEVTHSVVRNSIWGMEHTFNFSASYDRDSKWGGTIDSIYVKMVYQWALDMGYTEEEATSTHILDATTSPFGYFLSKLYPVDDGEEYPDNFYCWVKDNEGAVSDTVHFQVGSYNHLP